MKKVTLAMRLLISLRRSHSLGVENDETGVVVIDTRGIVEEIRDKYKNDTTADWKLTAFGYFLQVAAHEWAHAMGKTKEADADKFEKAFQEYLVQQLKNFDPQRFE